MSPFLTVLRLEGGVLMIDTLFAPLVVAIITGVVVDLFEHWLKNRNNK
ncbi:type I toxin-antitoxin system Fst family toxin [Enterococcus rotai]